MAKYKKIQKRKVKIQSIIVLVFVLVTTAFIYSTLFVKVKNVNLTMQIQELDEKIAQTRVVNDSLSLEIQELASYENISTVAKQAGLTNRQNNIISLRENP